MQITTTSFAILSLFAGTTLASLSPLDQTANPGPTLNHSGFDGIFTIELSDHNSWDVQGDSNNEMIDYLLGSNIQIFAMSWEIGIQTVGASWLSEVTLDFENNFYLTPGIGDDFAGTGSYSSNGFIDLVAEGFFLTTGNDAILSIEIFESFDDVNDEIDAFFLPGSRIDISIFPTPPSPGTTGALAIAGLVAARRRRA